MRRRVVIVASVLAALALLPTLKLIGVQLSGDDELVARGEDQRVRRVEMPAQRGSILDRNGVELAISIPRQRVVTNMALLRDEGIEDVVDLERLAGDLAPLLGVERSSLAEALVGAEPDDPWVRLAETVPEDRARAAVDELAEQGLDGVLILEDSTERVHPAGESALRLIGNLGPDGPAELAGIERTYDEQLTGRDGVKVIELGSSGQTIAGAEHMVREPRSGADVQLTLDRTLQHEVERIVAAGTAAAGGVRGIAIVGRPATGEILAAGSVERDDETGEMRLTDAPIALSNAYQAGSVFKLVTVAAAVEAGQVAPDTALEVPWRIVVDDRTFSDHEEHQTRAMTVTEIVADSSNVGTIKIAQQLGKQSLHDALVGFGFGAPTGVGHPAESGGLLPAVERWTNPDLAASAIGTHQSATALQLWAAYNVIANEGRYVQPRLVDSVISADGTRTRPEPAAPRQVISPGAAAAVSGMLEQVVRDGTGRALDLPGYAVAAKTGTSRMVSPTLVDRQDAYRWADGRYRYVAAFAGFFPADRPEVSITVLIEDSAAGLTGGTAAGPVFGDLAKLAIRELDIAPSAAGRPDPSAGRVRAAPAGLPPAAPEGSASESDSESDSEEDGTVE
jgi:cell division protein FtsI (penicillin-binding protein 3)